MKSLRLKVKKIDILIWESLSVLFVMIDSVGLGIHYVSKLR